MPLHFHLRPELHAMAKMAEMAKIAEMAKNHQPLTI